MITRTTIYYGNPQPQVCYSARRTLYMPAMSCFLLWLRSESFSFRTSRWRRRQCWEMQHPPRLSLRLTSKNCRTATIQGVTWVAVKHIVQALVIGGVVA